MDHNDVKTEIEVAHGIPLELFPGILDTIAEAVIATDASGRILYWNQAASDIFGHTRVEVIGKRVFEIIPPRMSPEATSELVKAIHANEPFEMEVTMGRRNGTLIPGTISFGPLSGWDGPGRYLGVVRDISEIREQEGQLRNAREELDTIFHAIGHPVMILDPQHTILDANLATQEALGKSMEELRGKKCFLMIHGTDHPPAGCPLEKLIRSSALETESMSFEAVGGTYLVSCTPMSSSSEKLTKIIHIATDITEEKEFEEELIEESNRSGLYLDLLGHDISNLNQGILSYLELAKDTMGFDLRTREYIQHSLQQAFAMANLVNNVKRLVTMENDPVSLTEVDAGKILAESIERTTSLLPDRRVVIDNTVEEGKVRVMANDLLDTVFQNLVGNSLKFNRMNTIHIWISSSYDEDSASWRFEFQDNGNGVPDAMKESIFTRLDRGEGHSHGSGLGLAIVKRIVVDLFGGKIRVVDRVEGDRTKGASFVVMLPGA